MPPGGFAGSFVGFACSAYRRRTEPPLFLCMPRSRQNTHVGLPALE